MKIYDSYILSSSKEKSWLYSRVFLQFLSSVLHVGLLLELFWLDLVIYHWICGYTCIKNGFRNKEV